MNFPVKVGVSGGQLNFDPETREVPQGQSGTIVWNPVNGQIQEITAIQIGDGWPYQQPTADAGKDTWSTGDPNEDAKTYKYTLSARLTDGTVVEVDPEILNRGGG